MPRISLRSAFHDLTGRSTFNAAAVAAFVLFGASNGNAQGLPALAKDLNPAETALVLVDFQYPFTNPAGANYRNVKKELEEKRLLDRTVDLVKRARSARRPGGPYHRRLQPRLPRTRPTNPAASIAARFAPGLEDRQQGDVLLRAAQPREGDKDSSCRRGSKQPRSAAPVSTRCCAPRGSGTSPSPGSPPMCASMPRSPTPMTRISRLRAARCHGRLFPEQSEQMLKNTYPMWSKVLSNDEWLGMFGLEQRTER